MSVCTLCHSKQWGRGEGGAALGLKHKNMALDSPYQNIFLHRCIERVISTKHPKANIGMCKYTKQCGAPMYM